MSETIVVIINGEVLANGSGSKITDQRTNARILADSLTPLFASGLNVAVLHGNKPQVGFVLFRSELGSHILHTIPLDVCGADTEGATGYMLSQAFRNTMKRSNLNRQVMCVITQTLVDASTPADEVPLKAIGPWYDREKADLYRQTRGWKMMEEPGHGYRRAVPSFPPVEILEMEGIRRQVEMGDIVIAAGGGGIPVVRNADGELEGIEAVIDTDQVGCLLAQHLNASQLLMVIERDRKFILSGLSTESAINLSVDSLDEILRRENLTSSSVQSKLIAASKFLHSGGKQVTITTLRMLPDTLANQSGLHISASGAPVELLHTVSS